MKVGLMGGTFNPIHLGHLIISEYIRNNFPLDKIIFIPSGNPPHKSWGELIATEHRYNMSLLATGSNLYFDVSLSEINRQGKSYTVDTINEFKSIHPNDDFYFIIGGDTLYELTKWHDYKTLFNITNFIVIDRPGFENLEIIDKIEELNRVYGARIFYLKGPLMDISSTEIRQNLRQNKSIKYLVPKEVEDYISFHKLYISEA